MTEAELEGTADLFESLLGKPVAALFHSRYYFNGEVEGAEDQGALELRFQDGTFLVLDTASDGQSVLAHQTAPLTPLQVSFGPEAHSEWKIEPWEAERQIPLDGVYLTEVEIQEDRWKNGGIVWSGWRLHFSSGDTVVYATMGDESRIYLNSLPPTHEVYFTSSWRRIAPR